MNILCSESSDPLDIFEALVELEDSLGLRRAGKASKHIALQFYGVKKIHRFSANRTF